MRLEILVAVGRERRLIHRSAVGDDHQDAARFGAGEQPAMCPHDSLTVEVLLEHFVVEKQPEADAGPSPWDIGPLDDDVLEGVEPSGILRIPVGRPFARRLTAVPVAGGEPEDLALHAAALEYLGEDLHRQRGDQHRTTAHRAGVIDQQADDRSWKRRVALLFEWARTPSSRSKRHSRTWRAINRRINRFASRATIERIDPNSASSCDRSVASSSRLASEAALTTRS